MQTSREKKSKNSKTLHFKKSLNFSTSANYYFKEYSWCIVDTF